MAKPKNKRPAKKSHAQAAQAPAIPQPLVGEISFRESALYRGFHPTPYNPDTLVGQKGLQIYRKMMIDEQIKAAVLAKHYAVLASGYEILPPDTEDAAKKDINKEMTAFVKFNFEDMEGSFDSKLLEILTATCYGFSVSEKVFQYIGYGSFKGKIGFKAIKTRQPFNIDFDVDEYGNLLDDGILQDQSRRMPKQKFLVYVYRKTFDNFYGDADLRSCYRPYWLKDNILRFMAITLERYGEPTWVFKHVGILSPTQRSELNAFIANMGVKKGLIIPEAVTPDVKEADPRTSTSYVPAIDLCDTHIRVGLLMPGLIGMSAEQAVGSLARSETEFDAFLWVIEQLRKDVETISDEQAIKPLVDLNYEVTDSKYPRFRFMKITEEIKQRLFKIWSEAVAGNALTKTREDENKARGLIDFPSLPDDVPVKGEPQAPGTILPDGRIVGPDGKPMDTAESIAMRQPPVVPFAHADGHKDYWFRALTKYEKRVDFKAIQAIFDKDSVSVDSQIRAELRKVRDSLLKRIEDADNAAQITSEFIAGLKLDTNQEVGRTLGDYLLGVWRKGRDLAFKELPFAVKVKVEPIKQFEKMTAYQTGLEPIDALNYFRMRALILAGVIDDELLKQAKFELLEHLKGGRPLIETIGNLRSVFEPWVGDPTKIGPSGQIGIGFPPGTMAPENILMAYRLENIIRTESTTAMAQGRVAMGDAAGDYVIGYELSAILDQRTTVICQTADGLRFRKEDPAAVKLLPALHYQCRTVPIFITSDDLPVEWSSQAEIDKVVRLIPAGFK